MEKSIQSYFEKANDAEQRVGSDKKHLNRYTDEICKYLDRCTGKIILDIGCGDGKTTQLVRQKTNARIIQYDFAYTLLARGLGERVCRNAVFLPFKEKTFDLIYSFSFLQYLNILQYQLVIHELARTLKSGGRIFHLSVPDRKYFWRHDRFPYCFLSKRPWRSPIRFLTYDYSLERDGSRWWNRKRIHIGLPSTVQAECYQSEECWYRMDVVYKKMKTPKCHQT